MESLRVSVIVPTLNEEWTIVSTLRDIIRQGAKEVIVVDGGSRDRTLSLAEPLASRVLTAEAGLARQLNQGAREATGDVLLFHFADLRLPEGGLEVIRDVLKRPEVVGGAFSLGFDSPRLAFRVIAFGANLRNRLGFGPFGDQAVFVRRETFESLRGYEPGTAFEDLDLVRRLKRVGRFVIVRPPVRSSVRRWERDGLLTTTFRHWLASLHYLLGSRRKARALKLWLQKRRQKAVSGKKVPGSREGQRNVQ
jgi:rSAM/selenodomain-associated transferase 2